MVEADDDGIYVVKFTGAGQGPKALVAEIVVAEIARRCGFASPSHFARVFKARTGVSPLELQRATEA